MGWRGSVPAGGGYVTTPNRNPTPHTPPHQKTQKTLAIPHKICYHQQESNQFRKERETTIKSNLGSNRVRINHDIKYPEVRVLGSSGEQLGVMSSQSALKMAIEAGVDLVEISPSATPPVVKVIDFGKFQYQKMKEQGKAKRNAKASKLKQIRLGLRIGDNDLQIKLKKVREFLEDGDNVRIVIVLKGREMAHKELSFDLMNKILDLLSDQAIANNKPVMSGRNLSVGVHKK
jgi:translation initiation factor IF-3